MEYAPPNGFDEMMQEYTAPCHGCRANLNFKIHPGMNGQLTCPFCGAVVYSRGSRALFGELPDRIKDMEIPRIKRIEVSQETTNATGIPRNPAVGDRKEKVRKSKSPPQGAPLLEKAKTPNTPEQDEALRKMLGFLSRDS